MTRLTLGVMLLALAVVPAAPQSPPPTGQNVTLSSDLLEAAELMPEADYLFKPTPETRPFGQPVSHLALSQFDLCSRLQGGPSPKATEKEEKLRSKAVLIELLKESAKLDTHRTPVPDAVPIA